MLPPDTMSGFLPWCVIVPLMQVNGCFPYKLSATGSPPIFSLPLCLWGIFLLFYRTIMCYVSTSHILQLYLTSDMGTTTFLYSVALMMFAMNSSSIALGLKSGIVAELLYELSDIKGVLSTPTKPWYCRPKALGVVSFLVANSIFTVWYVITVWGLTHVVEVSSIIMMNLSFTVNLVLPNQLPTVVFGLLARRLVAATEATVAMVSTLLAPDGSFKSESDVEGTVLALRDLDAVIREVELQREKGTRCFFPVITMFLLMSVMLAIASPYAMMKGTLMAGTTVAGVLIAYSFIASFCHVGQAFVKQVRVAEGLMKDLRVKSQSLTLSIKVNQVMCSLSSMLTFDMCDWYTLDYASFIGLMNTVLTYVVIIFQMGEYTVSSAPNNCTSSNSSAQA